MAFRTVTSFLLGFSLAAAGSAAAQAQHMAGNQQPSPVLPPPAIAQPATAQPAASTPAPSQSVFVVPAGTKIPLSLRTALSTKTARPGDAVYLSSNFPVIVGGRVVIPAGVYVQGYVDGLQRGGKVKGRAELMMHFVAMVFPNGVVIALPGAVDKVPGTNGAEVKDKEGLIVQDSNRSGDAKTVAGTTLTGAGVGGLIGSASGAPGTGAGIGAGVGAAVGIIGTMMKHGEDITFPEGSSVIMVMQRPLEVQEQQLAGMSNLTGYDVPQMTPVNAQQMPLPKPKPQPPAQPN
ncbi:MAG TPA: hypothetical protein VMB19_05810 [Silvibacterium sp.]|nr:hypothetical protein [Silvibacterium sp.]